LFIFRPIPPVGVVAAVELAIVSTIFLLRALFPKHFDHLRQRMERAFEKEPRTNIGQWVP